MRQFGEGSTESTVPAAVVDSHVHVWELDSEAFPWQPQLGVTATTAEPASGLVAGMHEAWVDGAVVVQSSVYGFDHRYLMHVLASEPERFRGVALVDPMNPHTASLMNAMSRTGRITGVRMIPLRADRNWFGSCAQPIWETAAEVGLAVTFLAGPAHFEEIGRWARRYREVAVVVDHFGSPDLSGGKPPRGIAGLLQLAELPNCHIKMSGLGAMSGEDFPYRDTWSFALESLGAFGAGRVMWGSDFPWLRHYGSTLRQSRFAAEMALTDLSDQDLGEIMGGTARRVFRFPDTHVTDLAV
jgi:L-fuconolactonase